MYFNVYHHFLSAIDHLTITLACILTAQRPYTRLTTRGINDVFVIPVELNDIQMAMLMKESICQN